MRLIHLRTITLCLSWLSGIASAALEQIPLLHHSTSNRPVSQSLFDDLEELARIVDIAYCVGSTSLGITKPFSCLSRCNDFPSFELAKTWNTGPLLSDSCGYIALDHGRSRVIVAFRGTYSIANTVVDLSTGVQEYVPYPGDDVDDDQAEEGYGSAEERIVGEDIEWQVLEDVGEYMKRDVILESTTSPKGPKCNNCTVHSGFHTAWLHTRDEILQDLIQQLLIYPEYSLHLVGHSLGGAVAALAALDLQARGWDPIVTTFGEPRIGNVGLAKFLDERFNLTEPVKDADEHDDMKQKYRRVTHISDPVPLLPLTEWNYAMHAGEIFISKSDLSPLIDDIQHCEGDTDQECIAGEDSTTWTATSDSNPGLSSASRNRDLLSTVKDEIHDVIHEPWGIPSRYKLWQLFFAHRDYFWRLGLCVPAATDEVDVGMKGGHGNLR